eukprot:Clim_evm32s88 gene=Clim_evmTU32s88
MPRTALSWFQKPYNLGKQVAQDLGRSMTFRNTQLKTLGYKLRLCAKRSKKADSKIKALQGERERMAETIASLKRQVKELQARERELHKDLQRAQQAIDRSGQHLRSPADSLPTFARLPGSGTAHASELSARALLRGSALKRSHAYGKISSEHDETPLSKRTKVSLWTTTRHQYSSRKRFWNAEDQTGIKKY